VDESTTAPPLAFRVVAGGEPTDEELAALLVALTPTGDGEPDVELTPAWTRAAMLEGVGVRPAASPTDLPTALPLG
jgi:hypothetical protein